MFSKLERKIKTWAAVTLPIRWIEPYMRGGDCLVFSADPLVIYVKDWVIRYRPGALLPILRQSRHRIVHLLISLSWAHDSDWMIKQLKLWQEQHLRRFQRHRVIFMVNSEAEHRMMTAAGLEHVWVNSNSFVNPAVFRILPGTEKHFDAVYDARISPFKRHDLAAGIKSLALITGRIIYHHDEPYIRSIRDILPQAHWFNNPLAADYHWMSFPEINAALNRCRVGLCLSAEEGAMYGSMQYLLAGLPVVSTQSRGGRDEFFDQDYVRIVADNKEAVAAGVREMLDCKLPPEEIRRRTLEKSERHKTRLFGLLDTICPDEDWRADMRCRWENWTSVFFSDCISPTAIRKRVEDAATCKTTSSIS